MTSDVLSSNAAGERQLYAHTHTRLRCACAKADARLGGTDSCSRKVLCVSFNHPENFSLGSSTKMEKPIQQQNTIQDSFLNSARKERSNITIYLMSGVKLTGRIKSFDKYSVILEAGSQEQLIFKHAISTVSLPRGGVRDYHYSRPLGPSDREQQHPAEPSAPPQANTAAAQEKP